ncbi:hypothetical protein Dimus_034174 [Dionaea muscipula]
MSGFLLTGIVRIYSKKVEYLHRDCRLFQKQLWTAFIAPDINLPENAAPDQYEAVTLPETYQLDALELDVYPSVDGAQDNHMRSLEDITLIDQVPTEREPYVAITFDNDIMPDLPQHEREADVQAHGDPMEAAENVADKETEPPDSSLRMRSADPNDLLLELPSPLFQANSSVITWVDSSSFRRKVLQYHQKLDDYDVMA